MAIQFLNNPKVGDNVKIEIGDSSDLQIYHDATNSYVKTTSGNLIIQNELNDADIVFKAYNSAGSLATYFDIDGSAGVTKFRIDTRHLDNVKANFGQSNDLQIYHDTTNSFITNSTGDFTISNTGDDLILKSADDFLLYVQGSELAIQAVGNAGVILRHNNVAKFETTSTGVTVTGTVNTGGGNAATPAIIFEGDTNTGFFHPAADAIGFSTAGLERIRILSTGNIAIGTTTASSKLTVQDNSYQVMLVDTSTSNRGEISVEDAAFGFYADRAEATADSSFFWSIDNLNKMEINLLGGGEGQLRLNDYGPGNITGTAEFILGVDANGNVIETSAGGSGTVTGTGAATRVAFWSGTTALSSDANLYWDNTNDRLGIGTNSPDNVLHIKKGDTTYASQVGADTMLFLETTNVSNALQFTSTNAGQQYIMFGDNDPNAGWISYNHVDNNLNFRVNATEKMRITSAGNVGIGTTSPSNKLHVNQDNDYAAKFGGTGGGSDFSIEIGQFGTNSSPGFNAVAGSMVFKIADSEAMRINTSLNVGIGTTAPAGKFNSYISATRQLTHNGNGGDLSIISDNNSSPVMFIKGTGNGDLLNVFDNTTEVFTILNGGNVGIGTNAPDYLLDLYKATSTGASATGTTIQRLWNYVGGDLSQQKTFVDFVFEDTNANEYPQVRIGAEVGQNGDANTQEKEGSGAFVVYTNNATGTGPGSPTGLAERFRVDYAGNVGIGTTSPAEKLEVAGSIKSTSRAISGGSTAGVTLSYDTANSIAKIETWTSKPLSIETAGIERMRITSAGNVGIGTTNPGEKLEVNGSTKVSGRLQVGAYTSSDSSIISQSGDIQLRVGSINITNNPFIRLQGNSGTSNVYADIKLDTVNQLLVFNDPGTTGGSIGANPMVLDAAGNVGIGTTTPADRLDVTDGNAKMVFGTASSDRPWLYFQHNAVPVDGEEIGILDFRGYNSASQDTRYVVLTAKAEDVTDGTEDGSLTFHTMKAGTSEQTLTLRSGNVGIGSDNPVTTYGGKGLVIENNDVAGIMLNDTTGAKFNISARSSDVLLYANTNTPIRIGTSGSERMRITSAGNVGIGTTSPDALLDVNGNAQINNYYVNGTNKGYIAAPKGGLYSTNVATKTGALEIGLPTGGAARNDMIKFVVDVYDYQTNRSFTVLINGYLNVAIGGNEWHNVGAQIISSSTANNYTIRFGNNGTNHCVWIGETTTTWRYPQVLVRDFYGGYATDITQYLSNWTVDFVTSGQDIEETLTNNFPLSSGGTSGAFLPLSGGTMSGAINLGNNNITNLNVLSFDDGISLFGGGDDSYLHYKSNDVGAGGIEFFDGNDVTQGYLYYDGNNAAPSFGLLDGSGTWGVRVVKDGLVELRHDNAIKLQTTSTGVTVTGTLNATTVNANSFTGYSNFVASLDTRNVNPDPEDKDKGVSFDFKTNSTNGLSDGGSYNGQMFWRSYGSGSDMSGGYPINIAYTANGNLWRRMGTSATGWGDWAKFALETNGAYLPLAGGTLTGDLTISEATPVLILKDSNGTTPSNTTGFISMREADGTQVAFVGMGSGSNNYLYLHGGTGTAVQIGSNGSTAMVIDTSQNVGIGTTTPDTKLEVEGSTNGTTSIKVSNPNTGTAARANLLLMSDAATLDIHATSSTYNGVSSWTDAGVISSGSQTSGGVIINSQSGGIKFQQGTVEKMRITNAGNLGIGTTSPGTKLDVLGATLGYAINNTATQARFRAGNDNNSQLYIQDYRTSAGNNWTNSGKRIQMQVDTTWMGYMQFNGTGNNGGISWGTGTSTTQANATEKIILKSNGNLGIGTTSPDSILHVESTASTGANFILESTHSGGIPLLDLKGAASAQLRYKNELNVIQSRIDFGDSGTFNFVDVPNNSSTLYLKTGGNVGIGTSAPTAKLTVVDNSNILSFSEHGSSAVAELKIIGAQAHDTAIYFGDSVDNVRAGFYYDVSSNQLQVRGYNNSTKIAITSAGAVGIGTTSPGTKLQVNGGVLLGSTYAQPSGSTWTTANSQLILGGAHNAEFNTGTKVKLLISGYDNDGTSTIYPIYLQDENGLDDFWIKNRQGQSNFPTMYFAGSVGIGTTTPDELLDVENGNIRLKSNSDGGNGILRIYDSAGVESGQLYPVAGDLRIFSNNDILFNQTGNVGIGTTAPGGKLSVSGIGSSVAPTLSLTNTSSLTFNHSINAFAPNLTTGESNILVFGRAGSAKNSAYIGYRYSGTAGSNNNLLILGHWASDNLMTISGDGNVGIGTGTATPAVKLHVAGASEVLRLESTSATGSPYISFFQTTTRRSYIYQNDTGNNLEIVSEYGGIKFFTGTNGTETQKMVIQSNGTVGIGTTNPVNPLQVTGKIYSSTDIQAASQVQAATYRWSATTTPLEQSSALTSSEPANPPDFTPDGYIEIKVQTTVYLIPIFEKQT